MWWHLKTAAGTQNIQSAVKRGIKWIWIISCRMWSSSVSRHWTLFSLQSRCTNHCSSSTPVHFLILLFCEFKILALALKLQLIFSLFFCLNCHLWTHSAEQFFKLHGGRNTDGDALQESWKLLQAERRKNSWASTLGTCTWTLFIYKHMEERARCRCTSIHVERLYVSGQRRTWCTWTRSRCSEPSPH